MRGVYDYVYKLLVEANLERDVAKADEAIKLLTYERETWALAVERAGAETAASNPAEAAAPAASLSRSA